MTDAIASSDGIGFMYSNLQNALFMKRWLSFSALVLVVLLGYVAYTLHQAGSFKTIVSAHEGIVLDSLKGLAGVEDLTIDQQTGVAFLSSDDRWAQRFGKARKGAIYALNLRDSLPKPLLLTGTFAEEDFHPHGISLLTTSDGLKYLFVVNHRLQTKVNTIERFAYRNDSLVHEHTFTDSLFISPNDVVAVAKEQFYFTNDHDRRPDFWRTVSDFLRLNSGYVVYFDGEKSQSVSEKMQYANGINVSLDGKELYVAASSGKEIYVYDRNGKTGGLTLTQTIALDTGPDNIEIDTAGNLWVGCHPQLLKFVAHASNPLSIAPSEVIKIDAQDHHVSTILINDGRALSASSVAAVYGPILLVGPVFQDKILIAKAKTNL